MHELLFGSLQVGPAILKQTFHGLAMLMVVEIYVPKSIGVIGI